MNSTNQILQNALRDMASEPTARDCVCLDCLGTGCDPDCPYCIGPHVFGLRQLQGHDLTGEHNSLTCVLGVDGPCEACKHANELVTRREQDEHALDVAMADFIASHGSEKFAEKIDAIMTEKAIW